MRRVFAAVAVAILLLGVGACSQEEARDTAGDVAEDVREGAEKAADEVGDAADRAEDVVNDRTVNIDNFAYEPKKVTVTRGTEVTWVNQDGVPHTVTSDAGNALDSDQLSEGDEFSERFLEDGTFDYHCEVHGKEKMSGSIVVER